jgi:REase_DpnII-MboI
MTSLKETAASLLASIRALQEALGPELADVQKSCAAVTKATQAVAGSWSGSPMGYHSELYYRDFEVPPLGAVFSTEWGGLNGIPAGWQKRSSDEVKGRVEKLSGVSITVLETSTDGVLQRAKALHSDIVTEISGLHLQPGLEEEKKLLKDLEKFRWGGTLAEYMDANLPRQFISRDSEAVYQGIRLSAHLYYAGLAFQKNSECMAVPAFFKAATRLLRQVELNTGPMGLSDGADQQPVKAVLAICDRFHAIAGQLNQRREGRPTLEIKDEYDVQDLVHALLRLYFDDIRPEEWTPSYCGGSSRMDFLLKGHEIVVEAKMTRKGLMAKEVSEQLIIDAAKYRQHPECKTLVCLVYDPTSLVKNPRGIERDLAKLSGNGLELICVITP